LILHRAWRASRGQDAHNERNTVDVHNAMRIARTAEGQTLLELCRRQPQLVVFLRHSGCTFCREALADLAEKRSRIEDEGIGIVLVHMSSIGDARALFEQHGLHDLPQISDPQQTLYRAFELKRGNLLQLFGPKNWWRGIAATLRGHHPGKLAGDGFQMPGVFLVHNGAVQRAFRHQTAADRPDYTELAWAVGAAQEAQMCST